MTDGYSSLVQVGLRRMQDAALAGPNSIAARSNPNNDGSIMSRTLPGAFGAYGALNPAFQQSQAAFNAALPPPTARANTPEAVNGPLAQSPYTQGVRDYMTGLHRPAQPGLPPSILPSIPSITSAPSSTGDDTETDPNASILP